MKRTRSTNKSLSRNKSQPKATPKNKKKQIVAEEESEISIENRSVSPSRGKRLLNQSQQNSVAFNKGSYIAFVDPSDNLETFKLALLTDDLRDIDQEVQADVYQEIAPLTYKRIATKQTIFEYCIITDVNVTADKTAKKNQPQVKVTKLVENKVHKLMVGVVQKIEQEKSDEEDDEFEDDDESSEESEDEDEEQEEEEVKESIEVIKSRRIIKGKTPLNKKVSPPKSQTRSTKKPKSQEQPKTKQVKGKKTNKKQQNEEEDKEDDKEQDKSMEEEADESVEQINTSSKQKSKKRLSSIPKVGEKRSRKPAKKNFDSEEGSQVNESQEDESSEIVKKRKMSKGKAQVIKTPKKKPAKKVPKKPTEFKKGKWNPDIELLEVEQYKESPKSQLFLECCIRCNNKNIIRAAISENDQLLKNGFEAKHKISSLNACWSPEVKWTALEYMVTKNLDHMLEVVLHPKVQVPVHSTYEIQREALYQSRAKNPPYLLSFIDSGMVSNMAYGTRIRKVQMTRGNRQGNNAFMEYIDDNTTPTQYTQYEWFLRRILYDEGMTVKTLQALIKLNNNIENTLNSYAFEAVRAGNRKIAHEIIKKLIKFPNWGFNQLHADVLDENAQLEKIMKMSAQKKSNTNKDITPIHCACINPNVKYLKALLDANPEYAIPDADLRRPVHYAAACVNSEPLQFLISLGAQLQDLDNQKTNCLHIAAMMGRHENVRLILQTTPALINTKTKKSMNALAFASKFGHTKCVEVLLEYKARVNAGVGIERMTPLCWGAAYGHYELCEFLLDNKGRVLGKDKFKRTPLILAVRNGHTKIAALLLQRGSEWNHCDSSMNTPLHYAAGYGWLECMDLLIKAGAEINAQNSWKITPINIGMLMNHQGCVKKLLDQPNVDVNCKDEKGRTLLILSMLVLEEDTVDFVKYLLQKGADPNITDLEGQGPLHYLAKYIPPMNHQNQWGVQQQQVQQQMKEEYQRKVKIQIKLTTLLIDNNADLTIKDGAKKTPFAICLDNDNAPLLDLLQNKVSLNKEPELFFAFKDKIFNVHYQEILIKLIKNDLPTKENINALDQEGMTPFLRFIESFVSQYDKLLQDILCKVNAQSHIHGNNEKQFKITNEDLFDKFADATNYYTYNYNLTNEQKNLIASQFLEKIVVQPFIKLLQRLIDFGADSKSKVDKLKKYRDEEEMKKLQFAQLAEGQSIQIKEEKVKKREEVLEEKQRMGRGKSHKRKALGRRGYFAQPAAAKASQPADYNQEIYDTRDGEKVLRLYSVNGQRNALHILINKPHPSIFDFLIDQNIEYDQPDYDLVTPFNLLSKSAVGAILFDEIYVKLISLDVRIDFPDIKGRTPFLNFYEKSDIIHAYQMLDKGANINQMDISGLFALKYALIRRDNDAITALIGKGANINQIDNKGRNLLHHAVNMSSSTADATFETEQLLIDEGIELNLRDNKMRTPLHYAFVKIQSWRESSQIDPIETVSSLCGCKGLEIDLKDKWLKTPLHYASQRGASICAIYLAKRGADLKSTDIYGNTPLGIGLLNQHYNYGIILIQNQISASVHDQVFKENPEKIKKQWEDEIKRSQQNGNKNDQDIVMEVDEDKPKSQKKHRKLFDANVNVYLNDYDDEDDENDDDNESIDSADVHQENIFNQQNAFGLQVFNQNPFGTNQFAGGSAFGGPAQKTGAFNFGNAQVQQQKQQQLDAGYLPAEDESVSMFKLAIRGGQQGLAYLMLDNGYDLMLAMQDAMDEKKFMLVLTLLSKNPNDEVVQSKNSKQQNLFHILSMNASGCSFIHLQRIYETLKKRGVDTRAKDIFQRTALHYAVKSQSIQLVNLLLNQADPYNTNEIDVEGHSPLSICLQGANSANQFYNRALQFENIFLVLVKKGADVNFVYPEKSFKPQLKIEDVDEQYQDYDPKGKYCSSFIINAIRQSLDKVQEENVIGLLEFGAKLNLVDSDGRDPIMYAVMQNNTNLLKLLLSNQRASSVNKECQDKIGKSAAHYVVNPVGFGSFENIEILRILKNNQFDLNLKDTAGKTPLHYASEQESGVLYKELSKLLGINNFQGLQRALSSVSTSQWPEPKVDFEIDSEQFMELAHDRENRIAREKENKVPVDSTGYFEKSYQVYYEGEKPWDVYLTKVDLKNGIYGDYVFYKMQLLYDTNRDLYVVFTRYGRIGETGMNQRTPFNNIDEAKVEFKKIFKQKSGGNNFDELETYARQKKKYNLAKVNYITVDFKDYLAPFDYEKCPKSRLSKPLYDLFEEVSNVTMYQRAMNQFGLDTNVMPFSAVKKESINQAKQLLMEISETIKEDIEISKQGIQADYDQLSAIKEKISELSSRYYELIPLSQYKNQIAPPLSNQHVIKQQFDNLESLSYIEHASKMLLGALLRQKEMNPIDYVHQALNMLIEPLDKEGPEFDVINTYINNTTTENYFDQNQYEIYNIFKIQRKGEAEMIQAFKDVPNHFLLYHGSMMQNFLGILSQGLRIAPPEAPPTGYMFGKGVYFADMFEKSLGYANRGYVQQESYLMMLSEVALGKSKELKVAEFVEKLEPQFHSVKGVGRRGPDYDNLIVLPNGVKIPYGKVKNYFPPENQTIGLQHNEYIVYNTSQIRMRYLIQIQKKKPQKK